MNEPLRKPPQTTGRSARKFLALFAAMLFAGMAIYASRASAPLAPASDPQDKEPAGATPEAVSAADKFLAALDAKQRETALYEYTSAKKPNWSNLPVTFVQRNGVALGDLSKEQRALALKVLAAVLSKGGYQKAIDIMDGDQKLAEGGGGKGGKDKGGKGGKGMFGVDKYYLAIFGKPSAMQPWMVQFGGHHLGVNVTVIGKHFVLTPTHTGTQPAIFKRDGKDVRPLGQENDTGFKLVNALDEKQRPKAVLADKAQGDLLLGPGRDGRKAPAPEGIKGADLTAEQQAMLLDVIAAWVDITEPATAKARMEEIKGKIGETYFSWKGPTARGSAAYFRVQGPTVWIEYAPQVGTDHIHTVIRNPQDDYGAGVLKAKE